jgi:hypothetical protein
MEKRIGLDVEKFEKTLDNYPQLEIILLSGVVSIKMCRELLDIDRWLMNDLYKDLVLMQAVVGISSSNFRAKPDAIEVIKQRRESRK